MNLVPINLCDAGEEREFLAAWRIFTGPWAFFLMQQANIPWPAGWCLLRVKRPHESRIQGDIDVLAGRLLSEPMVSALPENERHFRYIRNIAEGRRFFQPPGTQVTFDLSYLVGMEIKCAYVRGKEIGGGRAVPELKSVKNSIKKQQKLRRQLQNLLEMGLDKVFLLEVVPGIPSEARTVGDAIAWAALSTSTVDKQHERLLNGFAPDLPIGHLEITFGAQRGATEEVSGFCRFNPIRTAPDNPLLSNPEVVARRQRLIEHLQGLVPDMVAPPQIPVVLDHCPHCSLIGPYHSKTCSNRS